MLEIRGLQQSDVWLRARCGRETGSRLADVCNWVWKGAKARGDKRIEAGCDRKKYRRELIAERLTGRLADHWNSEYMAHGEREEEPARLFYEGITRQMVIPVSFVIHPDLPYSGASADGLIGSEGVLEVKNPNTTTHLGYWEDGRLPEDYVPQVAWEMACAGKERRWADFLSFDRRILDPNLCYFLKRTGRDELEWDVPTENGESRKLTGESVIEYFTNEVVRLNAEIEHFFAEHGVKAVAPFPVEVITEDGELVEEAAGDPEDFTGEGYAFLDRNELERVP